MDDQAGENIKNEYGKSVGVLLRDMQTSDDEGRINFAISEFQSRLEELAAKYQYDERLGNLRYKLYEIQAYIHYLNGKTEKALQFIEETIRIRGSTYQRAEELKQQIHRYQAPKISQQVEKSNFSEPPRQNEATGYRKEFHKINKKYVLYLILVLVVLSTFAGVKIIKTHDFEKQFGDWDNYKFKYDVASFRYPTTWTIVDSSAANSDSVAVNGPSNFKLNLQTNVTSRSVNLHAQVLAAIPIKFLGQSAFIDYVSLTKPNYVQLMCLSTSPSDFFDTVKSRVKDQPSKTQGSFIIAASYGAVNRGITSNQAETLQAAQKDINYQNAILILKSMKS